MGIWIPIFGDHLLVYFDTNSNKKESKKYVRRDWRNYYKEKLSSNLSVIDWRMGVQGIQQYWNVFEDLLITVIDKLAPLTEFAGELAKDTKCPKGFRNALNVNI